MPQQCETEPRVQVGVRFVPEGIRCRRDVPQPAYALLGTLVLHPASPKDLLQGPEVSLASWPACIETLVAAASSSIRVTICPATATDTTRPLPSNNKEAWRSLRGVRRFEHGRSTPSAWPRCRRHLDARWRSLIESARPSVSFADLAQALFNPVTPPADILPTGRGDAALALSLERARAVQLRQGSAGARDGEGLPTRAVRPDANPWAMPIDHLPKTPSSKNVNDTQQAQIEAPTQATLKLDRDRAGTLAKTQKAFSNNSIEVSKLRDHLAKAGERKAGPQSAADIAHAAANTSAAAPHLDVHLDRARSRHFAAKLPSSLEPSTRRCDPQWGAPAALTRFVTIQNQPTLARLFNFAIDIVVPLDQAALAALHAPACPEQPHSSSSDADAQYLFVSAALGNDVPRPIWTTAKLRFPTAADPDGLFWICTREELDACTLGLNRDQLLQQVVPSQIDGVLHLGACAIPEAPEGSPPAGGILDYRFDLVTSDIALATEHDLHADSQAADSEAQDGMPAITVPSGGLLLVDRWRQHQAVAQWAASDTRNPSRPDDLIIDAEDLTVGLVADVALETGGAPSFRCLSERQIRFGNTPAEQRLFAAAITVLEPDPGRRAALNVGVQVAPARIRTNPKNDGVPDHTAFVEDVLLHWRGPPLGADLHAASVRLAGTGALELAQTITLPTAGASRPPRQRFGWSYRLGARPQLTGGVLRPLAAAQLLYDGGYQGRCALPARRVLRHERIEAPIVLTPEGVLARRVAGPPETTTVMVVRGRGAAAACAYAGDAAPATTLRVLLPPRVSQAFADHHGAFDGVPDELCRGSAGHVRRPRGGLRDIDMDRRYDSDHAFPVWSRQQTSAGERLPDVPGWPTPVGDAIFRPRPAGADPAQRSQAFYPDPAARAMVFLARRLDGTPLPGVPLLVPVRLAGVRYPDVTPIALELTRAPSRTDGRATQETVLALRTRRGFVTGAAASQAVAAPVALAAGAVVGTGRGVRAIHVRATLEPGDQYALDAWCLPDAGDLADWFDLIESAAVLERVQAGSALSGRLPVADIDTLDRIAGTVLSTAGRLVVPELAARTTLSLAHAIARPNLAPRLEPPPGNTLQRLALRRASPVERTARLSVMTDTVAASPASPDPLEAQTDCLLEGTVWCQLDTTASLAVLAAAPGLVSGAFDDPQRGRSTDARARGLWPRDQTSPDAAAVPRRPRRVFGFDVDAEGRVSLPDEQAVLLQIDRLPEPDPDQRGASLSPLDILMLQQVAANPCTIGWSVQAAYPARLPDGKARVLRTRVAAVSRTAALIRDSDGAALSEAAQRLDSDVLPLALPANHAPARCSTISTVPSWRLEPYIEASGAVGVRRRAFLRVRLQRPWFSSGQGERLAVILWPPRLFDGVLQPDANHVRRGFDPASPSLMDLTGFADDDLGPGGAYVTRWGSDPTKPGPRPAGWLIPAAAFCGVSADVMGNPRQLRPWLPTDADADDVDVIYVPAAAMPVPRQAEDDAQSPSATLTVALLAFRPRFDIDSEHWYVDLPIDAGALSDPFVRLGLARYQGNAPACLRVSEPTTEMAQIMPPREARATPLPHAAGGCALEIVVSGPAAVSGADSTTAPASEGPPAAGDLAQGPLMRVTVLHRDAAGIDRPVTLVAPAAPAPPNGGAASPGAERYLRPRAAKDGAEWRTIFFLPDMPSPRAACRVLVEEIEVTRRASFDSAEPLAPHTPEGDCPAASGTRFAAILDLSAPFAALPGALPEAGGVLRVHHEP